MSRRIYILVPSLLLTISGYALADEYPEMREEFFSSRSSGGSLKSYTDKILSDEFTLNTADRKKTSLVLKNDGAYTARYKVEYCADDGTGEHRKFVYSSQALLTTGVARFDLPADAYYTKVYAEYATGLLWDPWKALYYTELCANMNEWSIYYTSTGRKNTIQFNNWGTLFKIRWGIATPDSYNSVLVRNINANPSLGCRF